MKIWIKVHMNSFMENIITRDHIHTMVVVLLMQLVMLHRRNYHKVLQFCLTTTDNDLTSLFCNLLDNAFEACHQLSEAYIEITTTKKKKTPFVIITMINSCRNNPFSKQTGKLLTMKPNKNMHGFGIKSIQKTIRKYHGDMQMYYNEDTGTFHTIITLKQPQTS
ncbi:MAG: ATP-binding protein [Lachnospiraceae bacterium]|nr:ATP-binding protein [Lachnospiraceae bacterium]